MKDDSFTIGLPCGGYVRLVDKLGTDLTPVNAARVSFEKESFELNDKDRKLIKYLAEHGHSSPFRHAVLQFEIRAPLMVARQWFKYRVGAASTEEPDFDSLEAWNESSRRYVTEDPEFYIPERWRSAPVDRKQGSGPDLDLDVSFGLSRSMVEHFKKSEELYRDALKIGLCAEQARLFLPAYALQVRWYWTASLYGVCHFLNQRLEDSAQVEIQEYAKAVYKLSREVFPVSVEQLTKDTKDI